MEYKVLLFGPSGFIGSKLLEQLLIMKVKVVAVTRTTKTSTNELLQYIDFEIVFNQNQQALNELQGVSHIINCLGEVENEQNMIEMNINIVNKILKLADRYKISNIIHLGSAGIYKKEGKVTVESPFEPSSFYEWSKFVADQILTLDQNKMNIQILRPTSVVGIGMKSTSFIRLIKMFNKYAYLYFKDLNKTFFHYISVDVVVDVICKCVEGKLKQNILLVCTDLNQLDFSKCFPKKLRYVYIPLFFLKSFFFFAYGLKRKQIQYLIDETYFETNIDYLNDQQQKMYTIKKVISELC
jgi:nucleoside-diphosphate-sugar epimerase